MAVIRGQGQDGRVHGRSIAPPRSAKQPHRNDDARSSALTCNEARARQHMVATRNALLGTTSLSVVYSSSCSNWSKVVCRALPSCNGHCWRADPLWVCKCPLCIVNLLSFSIERAKACRSISEASYPSGACIVALNTPPRAEMSSRSSSSVGRACQQAAR